MPAVLRDSIRGKSLDIVQPRRPFIRKLFQVTLNKILNSNKL